jgi:hypothetical protein
VYETHARIALEAGDLSEFLVAAARLDELRWGGREGGREGGRGGGGGGGVWGWVGGREGGVRRGSMKTASCYL